MASNKTLLEIAKKADLKITETPDSLMIKPTFRFKNSSNIGAVVFIVMGTACLAGFYFKPGMHWGQIAFICTLALLFVAIGITLLAMHFTTFVKAIPGKILYRNGFKPGELSISPSTTYAVRQRTHVSKSGTFMQTYHYIITQIVVKQHDNEFCILEYQLNKTPETEKGSLQLANHLVALLKSRANKHYI